MATRSYAIEGTGILLVEDTKEYEYFLKKVKEEKGFEEIWELCDCCDVNIIDADKYNVCSIQCLKENEFKDIYQNCILLIVDAPSFVGFLNGQKMTKENFINNCKKTWGSYLPEDFDYEVNSGEVSWVEVG